jgi:hypothetical protein
MTTHAAPTVASRLDCLPAAPVLEGKEIHALAFRRHQD